MTAQLTAGAAGILAQSAGGLGGQGSGGHALDSKGGNGGAGGAGNTVRLSGTGSSINTSGLAAPGLVLQSIGGGGGDGGNAYAVFSGTGGGGGAGGAAGNAFLTLANSSVITAGEDSPGLVAQSIGGGGGFGGDAEVAGAIPLIGATLAIGGQGGRGDTSSGNTAVVFGSSSDPAPSLILTQGNSSPGVLAQSIGGGGGLGGDATALNPGGALALTIGGDGGTGGLPGNTYVTNHGVIQTEGGHSTGVDAQSIGGGGGAGGGAMSVDVGAQLTMAIAVGGTGGAAGPGHDVNVANYSQINTLGSDAHGVQAQSVGGGGGHGGASLAEMVQVFNNPDFPSLALSTAIGGEGGSGAQGGTVGVSNAGAIFTTGPGSFGVFAQSIGGGGGDGGNSTATSTSVQSSDINITTAIGGTGGKGGLGGAVNVTNNGLITTLDESAIGVFAQSVGGGGGTGGFGTASTSSFTSGGSGGPSLVLTASVGGSGGSGNNAGTVTVDSTGGGIITRGDAAAGVFAQSVGGGGGMGGGSVANGSGGTFGITIGVGGQGGGGGDGGTVSVKSAGAILTAGGMAPAVSAQSIGGGGGVGGKAATGLEHRSRGDRRRFHRQGSGHRCRRDQSRK